MVNLAMTMTIITLYKQGKTQRQISKIMNKHRATVKKVIARYEKSQEESPEPYKRISSIEKWHEDIVGLISSKLSNVRIYEKLKEKGFGASYSSLSRYIRIHNISENTCIRFETTAGEEAQVDFGYIGRYPDALGKLRKAYIFNMRLSYSRYDYYEIVFDQKVATWIKCHINAFRYFGGVPKVIKLDNLKSGILTANFYEPIYQKEYKRMADHYNCLLSPCRPYQPQEKGKVESGIKYVKNNFVSGREFLSNADMNKQLEKWLLLANQRTHGTTKEKPIELLSEELYHLTPLPTKEFDMSSWHIRKVQKDCHITLDNNYYSVPSKYVATEVGVSMSDEIIKIYSGEELIATHTRSKEAGIFTTNTSHYAKNKRHCPGFKEYDDKCEATMKKIGVNSQLMLSYIKQEQPYHWQRTAQGIISLRTIYKDEEIDKACLRALHYGANTYIKIKKILESNSYNLPLNDYSDKGGEYATGN